MMIENKTKIFQIRCLKLFAQKLTSLTKRSRRFRWNWIPNKLCTTWFSLGNPGNQHERNPIGCLGRGGCVRHGRHDGAQLHAQHQDDLRQAVQCQLCQHHPKSQSQFFYIILYGLHKSDIKCTMVDHREGGKGHLRGRTSLHHVHSCSLGNHRKVWLLFFYLVLKHL